MLGRSEALKPTGDSVVAGHMYCEDGGWAVCVCGRLKVEKVHDPKAKSKAFTHCRSPLPVASLDVGFDVNLICT